MLAEQVPVGPVHTLEAMVDDPQILHNESYIDREHPTAGVIRQPRVPARFDKTPAEPGRLPPLYGEHTDEILGELGLDQGRARKAVRGRRRGLSVAAVSSRA